MLEVTPIVWDTKVTPLMLSPAENVETDSSPKNVTVGSAKVMNHI